MYRFKFLFMLTILMILYLYVDNCSACASRIHLSDVHFSKKTFQSIRYTFSYEGKNHSYVVHCVLTIFLNTEWLQNEINFVGKLW